MPAWVRISQQSSAPQHLTIFFFLFMATLVTYGRSWARGLFAASAAGL